MRPLPLPCGGRWPARAACASGWSGGGDHTAAFSRACGPLRDYYRSLALSAPKLELWSCATAARFPDDPKGVLELALRHWSRTVRFRETTEAMYEQGVRVFVEVGPGSSLTNFVANTLQNGRTRRSL